MPITPVTREALPYVRPAYEPDTRTLRELLALAGQSRANAVGRKGQARAEGLMTLGQVISQGLAGIRQGREQEQALALKRAEADRDALFRRDEFNLRKSELEAERQARQRLESRQIAADDRVAAMEAVDNTMPGPIDPATASLLRKYPGTAPLVSGQSELQARPTTTQIAGYAGTPNRRRALSAEEEADFQQWYAPIAGEMGLDPNPDSPAHLYDYRGAYRAGVTPDESTHWPSTFKQGGHPNLVVDGMDTRTMTAPPADPLAFADETMRAPQRFDVRGMTPKEERQARIDAQAQADRQADNARQLAAANAVKLEVEDVLLDGRPAKVVFNPATGKFQQNGVDVSARVKPIPPASQSQPREQKFVIRNGQVVPVLAGQAEPGDIPYSAEAMQGMGGEAADVRSSRAAAALNSIDKLKSLAPKRSPGLPGMAEGAAASVAGALGYNTGVRQYNALLQPTAMQMAVAIQGAAGLSNSEREAMAKMLGDISTMDYESQMALLENASQMIRSGADVDFVSVKDAKTGQPVDQWVPKRSRMPGSVVVDVNSGVRSAHGGKVRMKAPDGSVQEVDASMVDHYKSRGAKVVK